jgi:kynureninase
MEKLRAKSLLLTAYLEHLIIGELGGKVKIFTPANPEERGCQLSLSFQHDVEIVNKSLAAAGVICDVRKPDVMRVAPAPLYNSFGDVYRFVHILKGILDKL